MTANSSPDAEAGQPRAGAMRVFLREGGRYFAASCLALGADALLYTLLIRVAGVHYMAAAPAGFVLGLALHYVLSTRWVFSARRVTDARVEFIVFSLIGIGGLLLNQVVIYAGVEGFGLAPELAKVASAGASYVFNYGARKALLFSNQRAARWPVRES